MAEENFIACSAKYLPSEMLISAAEIAVTQNPLNRPANGGSAQLGLILDVPHLAVLTTKYWGNKGVKLTVGFPFESVAADLQRRIISYMNNWSKYCNVNFTLTNTDPQVRITLSGQGYWSYLGTDVLSIPRNEPTMCLQGFTMRTSDSECKRVIEHETGHTLGFPHEHMRRSIIERLDQQKTIAYFKQTQGWTPAMTMQQVLTPLAESSIMGTPDADENSVMTYSLPGQITKDGRPIIGGAGIEQQDAEFAAKLYPKADQPPEPPAPPAVIGEVQLSVDIVNKVIYASAPAGWRLAKKNTTNVGEMIAMSNANEANEASMNEGETRSNANCNQFNEWADELEALLPQGKQLNKAKASAIGGLLGEFFNLVTALRAGNIQGILEALYKLIGVALGKDGGGTGTDGGISFQTVSTQAGLNMDWGKISGVLAKIFPIIIAELFGSSS